jgi:hypothetical protein
MRNAIATGFRRTRLIDPHCAPDAAIWIGNRKRPQSRASHRRIQLRLEPALPKPGAAQNRVDHNASNSKRLAVPSARVT